MKTFMLADTTLRYDESMLTVCVEAGDRTWTTTTAPEIVLSDGTVVSFGQAASIEISEWKTGLGQGVLTRFSGFPNINISFETIYWIDNCRGELYCELIPLQDDKNTWKRILFPAPFVFEEKSKKSDRFISSRIGGAFHTGAKACGSSAFPTDK
ncbi:MAG: hypothetical protein PUD68_10615 [Clostridiales bacterium]|nr:hypothetical protein [Clostridiales bacterium]